MKFKTEWLLVVMATAALAACGGGSSDAADGSDAGVTATSESLATVKYASGCVAMGSRSRLADITVVGSLALATTTVSADVREFTGTSCATQTYRAYVKGVATLSTDTKVVTTDPSGSLTSTGWVRRVGRKAQLKIEDFSIAGLSLPASPTGQTVNFVFVEEGDKLYFSRGTRDADGYSSYLSPKTVVKQP